jgi:hypothetical protein
MMSDKITIGFLLFFLFVGLLFGFQYGQAEAKKAILECEKELPRNVNCTIIAVPVDKN